MNSYTPAELGIQYDRLRQEIAKLQQTVSVYGDLLDEVRNKVYALEHDTPQARRLQYELDATLADNAAAGYGNDGEW